MGRREVAVPGDSGLLEALCEDAGDPLKGGGGLQRLGDGGYDSVGTAWQLGDFVRLASAGSSRQGLDPGIGGGELRDESVGQRRRPLRTGLGQALIDAVAELHCADEG